MSPLTLALNPTSSPMAMSDSATMPVVKARRSPRNANCRGMNASRARKRREAWEVREARVRGQDQQQCGGDLDDDKNAPVPVTCLARLAEDRLLLGRVRHDLRRRDEVRDPQEQVPKMIAVPRSSVIRAFRHSGDLKAGTPSEIASTPVSATAPG